MVAIWNRTDEGGSGRVLLALMSCKVFGAVAASVDLAAPLHIALAADGFLACLSKWRVLLERSTRIVG